MSDSDDLGRQPRQNEREAGGSASRAAGRIAEAAGEAGSRAVDLARTGYDAASGQVAASPFSSLVVAMLVGVGVGWAMRGAHEEDRRARWLDGLPESVRRRLR
jgi:hypothetical protein